MLVRVAFGVGMVALGYFVGREVGRHESLRRSLERGETREDRGRGETPEPKVSEQSFGPDAKGACQE